MTGRSILHVFGIGDCDAQIGKKSKWEQLKDFLQQDTLGYAGSCA